MKIKIIIILVIGGIMFSNSIADEFLNSFLIGKYVIIGRKPNSDQVYQGSLSVKQEADSLLITRIIENRIVRGTAAIEHATADEISVLRIRFVENDLQYEGTFLISSDLDNYPRLTGYIYLRDSSTKRVGLEAWFADSGQLEN